MPDFYLTFGSQYARVPHPNYPDAHPDGWVRITAPDYITARRAAFRLAGREWCWLYSDIIEILSTSFGIPYFPQGEIAHLDADDIPLVFNDRPGMPADS